MRNLALVLLACSTLLGQDRVTNVLDGDTIRVIHGGVSRRVRLWGIDCPELKQVYGTRAKRFTTSLVGGKVVSLKVRDTDKFGRLVAEVMLPDGRNVNQEIVRAGYAWRYGYYAHQEKQLKVFEEEARAAKRGLWASRRPMSPWEFRRIHK